MSVCSCTELNKSNIDRLFGGVLTAAYGSNEFSSFFFSTSID